MRVCIDGRASTGAGLRARSTFAAAPNLSALHPVTLPALLCVFCLPQTMNAQSYYDAIQAQIKVGYGAQKAF